MLRSMLPVYIALGVVVAGTLSFTQFPSRAGPSEDAAWDLPYLGSDKYLRSIGAEKPMDYRFWPGQFDSKSYAPVQASRARVAHVPQAVRVAQVRKQESTPATLTIGRVVMSVVCRYVGAGNVLCHKNGVV